MKTIGAPKNAPASRIATTGLMPVSHRINTPAAAPSGPVPAAGTGPDGRAQGAQSFNVLAVTVFCVTLGASFYGTFCGEPAQPPAVQPDAPALRGTLAAAPFEVKEPGAMMLRAL